MVHLGDVLAPERHLEDLRHRLRRPGRLGVDPARLVDLVGPEAHVAVVRTQEDWARIAASIALGSNCRSCRPGREPDRPEERGPVATHREGEESCGEGRFRGEGGPQLGSDEVDLAVFLKLDDVGFEPACVPIRMGPDPNLFRGLSHRDCGEPLVDAEGRSGFLPDAEARRSKSSGSEAGAERAGGGSPGGTVPPPFVLADGGTTGRALASGGPESNSERPGSVGLWGPSTCFKSRTVCLESISTCLSRD